MTRKGNDIHLEAPISLIEAALGGTIKVPTLDGSVVLKIHKGANTGTVMRLKGKGVPRAKGEAGDMFVKLKVVLPDEGLGDLASSIEKWAKKTLMTRAGNWDGKERIGAKRERRRTAAVCGPKLFVVCLCG